MNKTKYYVGWTETTDYYSTSELFDTYNSKKDAEEAIDELYTKPNVDTQSIVVFRMKKMRYSKGETKIFE